MNIDSSHREPVNPERIKAFATFFKNYMGVSTIVTAALPIPIASFGIIPIFEAHKASLSAYGSMFCFLFLGLIFFYRHTIAKYIFYERKVDTIGNTILSLFIDNMRVFYRNIMRILPIIFIVISLVCLFEYNHLFINALNKLKENNLIKTSYLLKETEIDKIPYSVLLMSYYLGFFVSAETAFILMAVKEYLQDLLGLKEVELIHNSSGLKKQA